MDREERFAAMHPDLYAQAVEEPAGSGNYVMKVLRPGWQQVNEECFFHETQIDLSGYARQDLSFFPTSIGIQDPGIYTSVNAATPTGVNMQVLDIITSVPLIGDGTPGQVADAMLGGSAPGMISTLQDFETIMLGQYRWFTPESTFTGVGGLLALFRSQRFDSGEPTAADKLFCYRIIRIFKEGIPAPLQQGDLIRSPACRQLIAGIMTKEEDLVHMMRLKRSYELANQV